MKVSEPRDRLALFPDDLTVLVQASAEGDIHHKVTTVQMMFSALPFDYNINDVRNLDEVGAEEVYIKEVVVIAP